MATFAVLRHFVTILVKDFNNPDNLTNDLLILNPLKINKSLAQQVVVVLAVWDIFNNTNGSIFTS